MRNYLKKEEKKIHTEEEWSFQQVEHQITVEFSMHTTTHTHTQKKVLFFYYNNNNSEKISSTVTAAPIPVCPWIFPLTDDSY